MRDIKSVMTLRFSFRIPLWLLLAMISLVFCTPNVVSGAKGYYYYLHISSFRLDERAARDVKTLRRKGYNAITKRERVPNKGYWYRVYIGPFSSLGEAKLKREELRSKKLVDYVAIHKKESLISVDLEERKVLIEVEKPPPEVSIPAEVTPAVPEKPPAAKEVPVPIPSVEKRKEVKRPLPPPPKPPSKIRAKPSRKAPELAPKGKGRNMGRGSFALGLRHTYREVEAELTKRRRITSDGITTTVEEISVTGMEEDDFSTRLHMDSLRIRLGLTDYLEVFADIGGAYREFSEIGLAYGGGLRLNLFQVNGGWLRGFYGALQGEYLGGEVEYEYTSSVGSKWRKEADWKEFVAKGELGMTRSWLAAYIGGAYFYYREDTERQLLENLPPPFVLYLLQDELEEESLGAFGGIEVNLTPALLVNIEGQLISQKSIFGTLEYHF